MGTIPFGKSKRGLLSTLLLISIIVLCTITTNAQFSLPGYLLSQSPNQNVELYAYNSLNQQWKRVGNTGRSNIKSIAVRADNELIYAVDGGTLGKINPLTAQFTAIGNVGSGNGEHGIRSFTNIYGLAFDANREILYATNRNNNGIDELIKINPSTGKIIKNSMINSNGNLADYKIIDIQTFYFGSIYNSFKFFDLAYNNEDEILYITHNYFSTLHGINGYKNVDKQNPLEDFSLSPVSKLSGLDFDDEDKLYATQSDNKVSTGDVVTGAGGGIVNFFSNFKTIDVSKSAQTTFFGLDFYKIDHCRSHLTLNSPLLSNCPKIAKSTINSNIKINLNTQYIAGNSISLNNYFEAPKNLNFEATIQRFCN